MLFSSLRRALSGQNYDFNIPRNTRFPPRTTLLNTFDKTLININFEFKFAAATFMELQVYHFLSSW